MVLGACPTKKHTHCFVLHSQHQKCASKVIVSIPRRMKPCRHQVPAIAHFPENHRAADASQIFKSLFSWHWLASASAQPWPSHLCQCKRCRSVFVTCSLAEAVNLNSAAILDKTIRLHCSPQSAPRLLCCKQDKSAFFTRCN